MSKSVKNSKSVKMSKSAKMFIKVFTGVLIFGLIVGAGVVGGMLMGFIDTTSSLNINDLQLNETTFIYSIDPETGEKVEYERLYGEENRVWIDITDTPSYFGEAFVAIEDERFYKHSGFDIKSTSRAAFDYILKQDGRGASTITQQLIKNITGDKDATPTRKVQEILRAVNLEKKYTKEQVLELYMNTIYLSQGCYGVSSAADFYFGKKAIDLTLAECTAIAGITQFPTKFDPIVNPENNKEKQELILAKMLQLGYIDQATHDDAVAEELQFVGKSREASSKQSYFADMVIEDVLRDLVEVNGYPQAVAEKMLYNGGLSIDATIDITVQNAMDKVYKDPASIQKASDGTSPESAMAIIDPATGEIKGVVGGRGEKVANRTLNRATQAYRQPGSAIKPIAVYAPAVENNIITPATVYQDKQLNYGNGWSPKNFYSGFRGPVAISYAVEQSINTVAVQVMERMGVNVAVKFLEENLDISTLTNDDRSLSLALGGISNGISPLEMTAAYAPFVNRGVYTRPHSYTKVLDSSGKVILENKRRSHKAMSEQTATVMSYLLKGVVDRGTGGGASFSGSYGTGGKTGTTDKDIDRWFVGFTPYYVGAVWVGYDTPRSMSFLSSNPGVSMWRKIMQQIHAEKKLAAYALPVSSGIVSATYCTESGEVPGELCSSVRTSYFKSGTQPKTICESHEEEELEEDEEIEFDEEDEVPVSETEGTAAPAANTPASQQPTTSRPADNTQEKPSSSTQTPTQTTPPAQTPVDLGEPTV